ncbi:MAG: hypothetical protein JRE12_08715 [Deltaproteobacteria bacterium]|nr:hypothetical protein [Deltaproteobacteria bacterium]
MAAQTHTVIEKIDKCIGGVEVLKACLDTINADVPGFLYSGLVDVAERLLRDMNDVSQMVDELEATTG